jgi:hypothetical protein
VNVVIVSMSEESGRDDALTRLFQGEMLKHFTTNNQLLGQIVAILQQNQVLLLQMDKNIEQLKSNSF